MSFKGKVVTVTGSSSGIGAAIAIQFAKEGANVTIVGRNEVKLNKVAEQCESFGAKCVKIIADVASDDAAKRIVTETVEKLGQLDILVNNAGIAKTAFLLDENAVETFDLVMNTNFRSAVVITHHAAPHIIKTKGNIINISSIGGLQATATANFMPYCVSKAAMNHFTKFTAKELAPHGVRVNVVNPGPVKTDIAENAGYVPQAQDYFWQKMKEGTALKRVSDPEEIADLVLFLASDKAKAVTGSSYVSDNGMMIV